MVLTKEKHGEEYRIYRVVKRAISLKNPNFPVLLPLLMQDLSTVTELAELFSLIETLPVESREPFEQAITKAAEHLDRRQRIQHYIQEALVQLRLDMKYIMFDLEATKRERDELLGSK